MKKQFLKDASVRILVCNYQSNPDRNSPSSGAPQRIEATKISALPSISIAKNAESDLIGFDYGGRGASRSAAIVLYQRLDAMIFSVPKITTPEELLDIETTLSNVRRFSPVFVHKPLLILMENNPSDSELERSDKKAIITQFMAISMVTKIEYVDSLENKEEIEKNLVWLQEQVMYQILNPIPDYYSQKKAKKTGDDKPITQKIFEKKTKSVEKTIAKEEKMAAKMAAKQEKKQNGILGWLFK